MKLVLTLIFCILDLKFVVGWSAHAHSLIANIAAQSLRDETRNDMYIILGIKKDPERLEKWLMDVSDWADKESTESREYHFVHTTPTCEAYKADRDCGDDPITGVCIASAISNHIRIILDKHSDIDTLVASLKHLVHYMGDVHQPLHVGFRTDYGGNNLYVKGFNGDDPESLHSIWDGRLLWHKAQKQLGLTSPYKMIRLIKERTRRIDIDQMTLPIRGVNLYNATDVDMMVASLVSETSRDITCKIYTDMETPSKPIHKNQQLSDNYKNRGGDLVYLQVKKAGFRLGALLNSIFSHRKTSR